MSPDATRTVLIAGPTASGKSALALALAREGGPARIVNADSMQVYRELRVLTARPSPAEEEMVPHVLYGHVGAHEPYSVARWVGEVQVELAAARAEGQRLIIVGGTGLYFKALLEGLSPVPSIPDEVRLEWRRIATAAGPGELHRALAAVDPTMAARLAPRDTQRVTRALEVVHGTGRSLAEWQAMPGEPVLDANEVERLVLRPPRALLHERADRRFDQMLAAGALQEVADLLALGLAEDAPPMRAIGVAEVAAHLRGELALGAAAARAKIATRQYIKRQETWLRRHMYAWKEITS